ncbi:MAG: NYN domain-containing protein [Candidatus Omnitrophota bacterium]|nr:NYN domain-containing protein [Candidatus Omnitrophota bacterium]
MSLQYIIDGCNIIHHPLYIKLNPGKNNDSRLALLDFIRFSGYCVSGKNKVTVVFDGYAQRQSLVLSDSEIRVIFSGADTADERIKRIIEQAERTKNLIVVSDDNEIRYFAKSARIDVLRVEEFFKKKNPVRMGNETQDVKLTYTQMHKINEELKRIWL